MYQRCAICKTYSIWYDLFVDVCNFDLKKNKNKQNNKLGSVDTWSHQAFPVTFARGRPWGNSAADCPWWALPWSWRHPTRPWPNKVRVENIGRPSPKLKTCIDRSFYLSVYLLAYLRIYRSVYPCVSTYLYTCDIYIYMNNHAYTVYYIYVYI